MRKKINMFPEQPQPPYTMADKDIPAELFELLPEDEKKTDVINRPSISYWKNAWTGRITTLFIRRRVWSTSWERICLGATSLSALPTVLESV